MKLLHACSCSFLFACCCLPASAAEEKKPEQRSEVKQASNVEVSGPTSRLSPALSATLLSKLPKYQKPAPPPDRPRDPTIPETDEEEALPEDKPLAADQPKNKIIRLPRYVVEADRPPIFREKDIYTKSALAKIAMQRYLSRLDTKVLNRFILPIIGMTPEQRAMMIYEEEQRLQNMADISDAARAARLSGDKAEADSLKREGDKTFLRSPGMDWGFPKD